jgi:hypothetical protein
MVYNNSGPGVAIIPDIDLEHLALQWLKTGTNVFEMDSCLSSTECRSITDPAWPDEGFCLLCFGFETKPSDV